MPLEDRIVVDTPEGVTIDLALAGLGSRILARLLDTLVQYGVINALNLAIGAGLGLAPAGGVTGWIGAVVILVYFVVIFAYDIVFELAWKGQTIGKRALGLRVVRRGGRPIGFWSSCVRNVLRLADMLPFAYFVGSAAIFWSRTHRRLGDMAAGTYVIRERRGQPSSAAIAWAARPTVAPQAVATWDVSDVDDGDMTLVRRFLDRRLSLPAAARWGVSVDLASYLAGKVAGVPTGVHPEYVIEGVAVAKAVRAGA